MRGLLVLGMALVTCCGSSVTGVVSAGAPVLSRLSAAEVVLRADDAKRVALATEQAAGLSKVFRGQALRVLEAQVERMRQRGLRLEERDLARALVSWDPHAGEAVLGVAGRHRLVTPDQQEPAWAATERQWWSRLQYMDGTWWVVDQRDLTPDQWRVAVPT